MSVYHCKIYIPLPGNFQSACLSRRIFLPAPDLLLYILQKPKWFITVAEIANIKESVVVIISVGDPAPGEKPNLEKNLQIFRKVIPAVAKWCPRAIIVVATQPIEVMSYIAWKLSKFPPNRVLGTGTLIDSVRFQYYMGQKLHLASTSISCMNIGAQGDHSGIQKILLFPT